MVLNNNEKGSSAHEKQARHLITITIQPPPEYWQNAVISGAVRLSMNARSTSRCSGGFFSPDRT